MGSKRTWFKEIQIMIKNCLFAVALLSLALAGGCAKGGNGTAPPPITIDVTITSPKDVIASAVYPTQSLTLTATVMNSTNTAVTWSLSGAGTLTPVTPPTTPATATYMAPATAGSQPTITATLASDSSKTGSLTITLLAVTVVVTPTAVTVGQGLVQQFTAVAVPDDAPQTFNWTCTPSTACVDFTCPTGPGTPPSCEGAPGYAVYAAPSTSQTGISVTATSTVAQTPAGFDQAKVQVATLRLPAGAYAFRFSGYDNSNNPVAVAGSLTVAANGSISGVEDVLTAGATTQYAIALGSYIPISSNNNLGTLTLPLNGGTTNTYTAVLTSSGIMRMIESDGAGTGSGVLQKSAAGTVFNAGAQTFVFGFTGVDLTGGRVGYVGMLPMTPSGTGGTITGGLLDSNDDGSTISVCSSPPCSLTGTYQVVANGLWHMTLNTGTTTLQFDFFVSAGTAQTKTGPDPLTLYAISTDLVDAMHPALSGSMVYQVPLSTSTCPAPCYNNAAFAGTSVSNLTGATANVSLTLGTTDGTSGGAGGAGGFTGTFDQNNNGTITSVGPAAPFSYTYVATGTTNGRYTFQMLGNPNASPVAPPVPFVLYASGANRGFLLDQSSSAVMTGTMDPQPTKAVNYTPSELPGTYAAATISNSNSTLVQPVVQSLLLTSPGGGVSNVTGTQNTQSGSQALTGLYTMTLTGTGTITLTSPPPPAVATNVIYAIDFDSANSVITDFMMMGTTSGTPSSIMFAQQ
jgi:hypothetical protein